jgi:RNA polymerase sigma factor (sigma-70 family)
MLPPREWEDAFGEVILRVFQRLPKYAGANEAGHPAQFGTYATRIAIGVCADIYKRLDKTIRPASEETLEALNSGSQPADKGLQLDFERAFSMLTPMQRHVFQLHYGEQRKFAEIATILERAEPTLRSIYNRAIARLRKELVGYNEQPRGKRKCRRSGKR